MTYTTLSERLKDAWEDCTASEEKRATPGKREYVYASQWRPCLRAMVLDMTHPEDSEYSHDTLERFRAGKDFERTVRAHLIRAGQHAQPCFDVEGGQERFEIRDRKGRLTIVGKVDGKLVWPSWRAIFEVKGGESVKNVDTIDDFNRSVWTRSMLRQLLIYMLADNCEHGVMILRRPGAPHFIHIIMGDYELNMAEQFLSSAEKAVDVVMGEADMPEFHDDPEECRRCDHRGKSCAPPIEYGSGLQLITDENLIELARVRQEHEDAAKLFSNADKALKNALRGVELAHLGDFVVEGKWSPNTVYKIPDEIKRQYKSVDPQGRWLMRITEVGK